MEVRETIAREISPTAWEQYKPGYQDIKRERQRHAFRKTDVLLAALDKAGYAVVPKEPTKAMLEAGEKASNDTHDGSMTTDGWEDCWDDMKIAANVYRAMLTAPPDCALEGGGAA